MASRITADQFATELLSAAVQAPVLAVPVVKKAANNIKTEGRANAVASAPTHHGRAPNTINYDEPTLAGTKVVSEVGYDRDIDKAANLAWVLEYGGGGDHSPPHMDINRAADAEEARFVAGIVGMVGRLL